MIIQYSDEEHVKRIIELRLPLRLGYEKVVMDTASSLARRRGLGSDRIEALRTAVLEAVTNAIEHGNDQGSGMKVLVMLTDDGDYYLVTHPDPSYIDAHSFLLEQRQPHQRCLIILNIVLDG